MKDFDFYQIAGVIAPGMVVIAGVVFLFFPEEQKAVLSISNVSIGGLGVGLLIAYVVGQLLQAIGNGFEEFWWWIRGGWPTDWVRTGKHKPMQPDQLMIIQEKLRVILKNDHFNVESLTRKEWRSVTSQIYSKVENANVNRRVDIFNANYGLSRGLVATTFVLMFGQVLCCGWTIAIWLFLLGLLILSIYRMDRAGRTYARELFSKFLDTKGE